MKRKKQQKPRTGGPQGKYADVSPEECTYYYRSVVQLHSTEVVL